MDPGQLREGVVAFMRAQMVYKLIPNSGKVVVFDSALQVGDAFGGLLHHNVNCAPVWDATKRKYVGMLTVSDFIDVLLAYAASGGSKEVEDSQAISKQRIADWQGIKQKRGTSINRLLCIFPESTIEESVKTLVDNRIHRVCVVQLALANTVLCVLSQHRILKFLCKRCPALQDTKTVVNDLWPGICDAVVPSVTYDTQLIDVLKVLVNHKLSAVPIVDKNGVAVDAYQRTDVRFLAADGTYTKLDMTVKQALANHSTNRQLASCTRQDTIYTVCTRLVASGQHLLVLLRPDRTIEGLISIASLLTFFLGRSLDPADRDRDRDRRPRAQMHMQQVAVPAPSHSAQGQAQGQAQAQAQASLQPVMHPATQSSKTFLAFSTAPGPAVSPAFGAPPSRRHTPDPSPAGAGMGDSGSSPSPASASSSEAGSSADSAITSGAGTGKTSAGGAGAGAGTGAGVDIVPPHAPPPVVAWGPDSGSVSTAEAMRATNSDAAGDITMSISELEDAVPEISGSEFGVSPMHATPAESPSLSPRRSVIDDDSMQDIE